MRLRGFLFLLGLISLPVITSAQTVDMDKDHVRMTELTGPWRFHTGDNPAWSSPDFDDHDWSVIRADRGWSEQGYRGYSGMAWYRLQIKLPAHHNPIALYLPNVDRICEIFANGRLVGGIGSLPPHTRLVNERRALFSIPESEAIPDKPLLLAIRVWKPRAFAALPGGGIYPDPRIGEVQAIAEWQALQIRTAFWESSAVIMDFYIDMIVAVAILGLFWLRRKEYEYLWYGVNQLMWACFQILLLYFSFGAPDYFRWLIAQSCALGLAWYCGLEFIRTLLKQGRSWLYWIAFSSVLLSIAPRLLTRNLPVPASWFLVFYFAILTTMLILGVRAKNSDAGFVLVPVSLQLISTILVALMQALPGHAWAQAVARFMEGTRWPFPISVLRLSGDLEAFVVLIILLRRFAQSRRDEEQMKSELQAARLVQQVLVPVEIPSIPGIRIESVYTPAGQVGGDFFQIIPTASGGALAAVGDVSGKGMPAAMTVSLLVGTLRTLAHYTQCPSEILAAMNVRMLARSKGGFTTCVVLRIDKDGTLTVANAGHIAPFVNGAELNVENGFPLGLNAETSYPETKYSLEHEAQITVVTDGVVEARAKSGELFGFDRTQRISREPAAEIARAAQAFGQDDDITVLTLVFAGNPIGG